MLATMDRWRNIGREIEPISRAWYAEPQLWCLLLLTVGIFLPRLTTLTIRGEESRRAVIAREMVETGDWIVPRTQGVVRLSRPPLQNWLIATGALVMGEMTPWAVRLPGFLCTVLTVGLIYWYARKQLQPAGAVVAGLAYASMLQVLEQGRTGETEPVFTLLIAAAHFVWHGGRMSGWRPATYWMAGAAFAGLATLTKGLQAPIYFWATTWGYLVLSGNFAQLRSRAHLAGILTFVGVIGAWQLPFLWMMGWENSWLIYFRNVASRFHDNRLTTFFLHLLTYPPSIVCGCLAPWSLLLLAFTDRDIRQQIGPRRDMLLFVLFAIAICFPSVWLPPEARPRYFMPLFPCFAVLIGVAAELMIEAANLGAIRLWGWFTRLGSIVMVLAGVGMLTWSFAGSGHRAPDLKETLPYALCVLPLAVILWRQGIAPSRHTVPRGAFVMAAFLGLSYVGPVISDQQARSNNLPEAIDELRHKLPAETRLVSFDHIHHAFLHYYDETVPLLDPPQSTADIPADIEYFCHRLEKGDTVNFPFEWEPLAELSVDRNVRAIPDEKIIVGRIVRTTGERPTSIARQPQPDRTVQ